MNIDINSVVYSWAGAGWVFTAPFVLMGTGAFLFISVLAVKDTKESIGRLLPGLIARFKHWRVLNGRAIH